MKSKVETIKPDFNPVKVMVIFDDEKEFGQFDFLVSLSTKEMNKLLPKELRFTGKEEYTWMDALQEGMEDV